MSRWYNFFWNKNCKIVKVKKKSTKKYYAAALIKFLEAIRCKTASGKKPLRHAEYSLSFPYNCQSTKGSVLYSTWIIRSSMFLLIHVNTVLCIVGTLCPFSFTDTLSSFFWLISLNLNEQRSLNKYVYSQIYLYKLSKYF